jgi:hypothetical protein
MTWFKVDDGLCAHPKPRKAGLAAMGLWAVAGSYSSQQLTDGFIPEWYVQSWASGRKHADALVNAGLWVRVESPEPGWQFHDWTQSNPTRAQEIARREKEAKRQAEWRRRKAVDDDGGTR